MSDPAGGHPATVTVEPPSLPAPPGAVAATERLFGHHPGLSRVIHLLGPVVGAVLCAVALVYFGPEGVRAFLVEQADLGHPGTLRIESCTVSRWETDCRGVLRLDDRSLAPIPVDAHTTDASTADEGRAVRVRAWDAGSDQVYIPGGDSWFLYAMITAAALLFAPVLAVLGFARVRYGIAAWRRGNPSGDPTVPLPPSARSIVPATARRARPWVEWSLIVTGAVLALLAGAGLLGALSSLSDPYGGGLTADSVASPLLITTVLLPCAVALAAEGTLRLLRLRARGRAWNLDAGSAGCSALPSPTSMLLSTRWILPLGLFLTVGFIVSEPAWPAVPVALVALVLAGVEVTAARRHRIALSGTGIEVADGYGTHQIPWAEVRGLAQDDEHGYLVSLTGDRGLPLDRYLAHTARNEPLLWTVAQRAAAADRKRPIHPSHAESQEDAFLDRMPGLMEYMGMGAIMLALLPVLWIAVDVVAWLRGRLSVAAMLVTVGLLLLVVGIPFARPLVRAGRRGIHAGDPHHRLLGWLRLGIGLALTAGAVLLCVLILLRPFR